MLRQDQRPQSNGIEPIHGVRGSHTRSMPTTQPHAASLLYVLLQLPQRDVGLLAHGGPQLLLYLRRHPAHRSVTRKRHR